MSVAMEGRICGLEDRVYFAVPFTEKDRAKRLGGRWDTARGAWYAPAGVDVTAFARWRRLNDGMPPWAIMAPPTPHTQHSRADIPH